MCFPSRHVQMEDPLHISALSHINPNAVCPMCQFFWKTRWRHDPHRPDDQYSLYGFSSRYLFRSKLPDSATHTLLLGVVPRYDEVDIRNLSHLVGFAKGLNFIAPTIDTLHRIEAIDSTSALPQSIYGRSISSDYVDFRLLQDWIGSPTATINGDENQELPSYLPVNFIDLCSRRVVPAPSGAPKFVALSYVWGSGREPRRECQMVDGHLTLPDRCPETIEDAITVAMKLGFLYLWVDQYCINEEPNARHAQIANMDIIYKVSTVTIIAAAGNGSGYGLPGVSRPRIPQWSCKSGPISLLSIRLDTLHQLNSSVFNTRAWTYQERIFSSRSLVFTDTQVFMQYGDTVLLETLSTPNDRIAFASKKAGALLKEMHLRFDEEEFSLQRQFFINGRIDEVWRADQYLDYHFDPMALRIFKHHIQLYTRRNLSYDSDALNAIAAVLECFERDKTPIKNICGIPYMDYAEGDYFPSSLPEGLSWVHVHTDLGQLNFRRRPGFPSWSWAGWDGEACWFEPPDWLKRVVENPCNFNHVCGRCNTSVFEFHPTNISLFRSEYDGKSEQGWDSQVNEVSLKLKVPHPSLLLVEADTITVDFQEREFLRNPWDVENSHGIFLKIGHKKTRQSKGKSRWTNGKTRRSNGRAVPDDIYLYVSQWDLRPELQQMSTGRFLAICLGRTHSQDPCVMYLLVVTEPKTESDWTERVGIMKVPILWYMEQHKEERKFLFG